MAPQSGFQTNTTIHAAFWIYKPNNSIDREVMVEVNSLQFIESTPDRTKVFLYYAANNQSPTQQPYILEGAAALAFMTDMEALF